MGWDRLNWFGLAGFGWNLLGLACLRLAWLGWIRLERVEIHLDGLG